MDALTKGLLQDEQPTFAKTAEFLHALTDFGLVEKQAEAEGGDEGSVAEDRRPGNRKRLKGKEAIDALRRIRESGFPPGRQFYARLSPSAFRSLVPKEKVAYGAPWDSSFGGPSGSGISRWAESYKWGPKQKVRAIQIAQKWLALKVQHDKASIADFRGRPPRSWERALDKNREERRKLGAEGWALEREHLNDEMKQAKEDVRYDQDRRPRTVKSAGYRAGMLTGAGIGAVAGGAREYKRAKEKRLSEDALLDILRKKMRGEEITEDDKAALLEARVKERSPARRAVRGGVLGAIAGGTAGRSIQKSIRRIRGTEGALKTASVTKLVRAPVKGIFQRIFGRPKGFVAIGKMSKSEGKAVVDMLPGLTAKGLPGRLDPGKLKQQYGGLGVFIGPGEKVYVHKSLMAKKFPAEAPKFGVTPKSGPAAAPEGAPAVKTEGEGGMFSGVKRWAGEKMRQHPVAAPLAIGGGAMYAGSKLLSPSEPQAPSY